MAQNLKFYPQLMYRTPAFNLNRTLADAFNELKIYIGDASPEFLKQIENTDLKELYKANDNRLFSLWKYFNRAQYRATPFARFSAITLASAINKESATDKTLIDSQLTVHRFRDWDDVERVKYTANGSTTTIILNSTWYVVGNEHRYTTFNNYIYSVCRIQRTEIIDFVVELCADKIERSQLITLIKEKFSLRKTTALQLINELIENQLLWTDSMPNLTGDDFFKRTGAICETSNHYIIAERKLVNGGQNMDSLAHMPGLINLLNQSIPAQPDANLEQFKQQFLQKFDQQFVPLTIALDPELGIDFATLSNSSAMQQDQLPVVFSTKATPKDKLSGIPDSEIKSFLLSRLVSGAQIIQLNEFEPAEKADAPYMGNTTAVIYHMHRRQPVLHSIGGCTANAILGRFTMCNNEITTLAKNIADLEAQANPDVLFFDVSFRAEQHVDNINRRQQVYQAELPLSGWSTHQLPLHLNDVYIGVRRNQIILYSFKLQKRIVPRIASAYNHQRSNFAVYRFLAALQYQQVRPHLSLSLADYFPGLDHYPRVQYHNIVVCPQTWKVPSAILKQAKTANEQQFADDLKTWLTEKNIVHYFNVGYADQKLVFNPANSTDLKFFAAYCRQQAEQNVYISEALIDTSTEVVDKNGQPFFSESVLPVFHEETIYEPFKASWLSEINHQHTSRKFYPGDDWHYLEIYCHTARTNSILTTAWQCVAKQHKPAIRKWFFIRYNNGGNHLRLRFQLQSADQFQQIVSALKEKLQPELTSGLIPDIQVKTYVREVERYHHGGIDNAERFFYEDSKWVLYVLNQQCHTDDLYTYAIQTMDKLLQRGFTDELAQYQFVKTMADQFSDEIELNTADFKSLNKCYKTFRAAYPVAKPLLKKPAESYLVAFDNYITACNNSETVFSFTADAIHMHINRLFSTEQRQHEAILYQYLLNDMKKRRHALAQQAQSLYAL